jgi:hypothetical protein
MIFGPRPVCEVINGRHTRHIVRFENEWRSGWKHFWRLRCPYATIYGAKGFCRTDNFSRLERFDSFAGQAASAIRAFEQRWFAGFQF